MCYAGIKISSKSDNPIISFVGFNMVVVPMAAVLSILLSGVPNLSILNAAAITAVVAFVMIVAAIAFPKVFLTTGRILGTILIAVIIIELLIWIFGWYHPSFLDWVVALIFCGFIGYNWACAQKKPRTLDNAVDSGVWLYISVINLFRRVLRIIRR